MTSEWHPEARKAWWKWWNGLTAEEKSELRREGAYKAWFTRRINGSRVNQYG